MVTPTSTETSFSVAAELRPRSLRLAFSGAVNALYAVNRVWGAEGGHECGGILDLEKLLIERLPQGYSGRADVL